MACKYCSGNRTERYGKDKGKLIFDQYTETYPPAFSEGADIKCADISIQSFGFENGDFSKGELMVSFEGYVESTLVIQALGKEIESGEEIEAKVMVPIEIENIVFDVNFCPLCGEDLRKPKTTKG